MMRLSALSPGAPRSSERTPPRRPAPPTGRGAGIHDGRRRKSLLAEAPARHPPCDTAPHPLSNVEAEGEVRRCLAAAYVRETV